MKNYKMDELKEKKTVDLKKDLVKLQGELNDIKVGFVNRKMSDDTSSHRKTKKQIARLKTAMSLVGEEPKVDKGAKK